MSKNYQGIYLFDEWIEALNELPPKTAMAIIHDTYLLARRGIEPQPITGRGKTIQSIMLAYQRRTKTAADYGRKGAENRWGKQKSSSQQGTSVSTTAPATPFICPLEDESTLSEEDRAWDAQRVERLMAARARRDAAERAAQAVTKPSNS